MDVVPHSVTHHVTTPHGTAIVTITNGDLASFKMVGQPVSKTTQALIDLLIERDVAGRAKYGTTLDRTDLTHDQWLQHMAEELLDGAGYALAAKRTGAD